MNGGLVISHCWIFDGKLLGRRVHRVHRSEAETLCAALVVSE